MNKRTFAFSIIAAFFVALTCALITLTDFKMTVAGSSDFQNGSKEHPYLIENKDDLENVRKNPSGYYKLACDIKFDDSDDFEPLFSESEPFNGTFDGCGHSIINFYSNAKVPSLGLFGCVGESGLIKNLGMEDGYLYSTSAYVGMFAGINKGTIECCYSTSKIYSHVNRATVGAIAGKNLGSISNCYNTGSLTVNYYTTLGGIVGENSGKNVSYCYNVGNLSSASLKGGIVGKGESLACHCLVDSSTYINGNDPDSRKGDSASELKTQSTYKGWDFSNIWTVSNTQNNGYPTLLKKEDIPSLSSLHIDDVKLSPEFKSDVTEYSGKVDNDVDSVTIDATPSVNNFQVLINGKNDNTVSLKPGENKIEIKVSSKSGKFVLYNVKINKALSSDARLETLKISKGDLFPAFDSNTEDYQAEVDNDITSINVAATPHDSGADVKINGTYSHDIALETGDNMITILVTAQDGTQKQYSVRVYRDKSTDFYLQSLSLSGCDVSPAFNPDVISYTADVSENTDSITVFAKARSSAAKIHVNGETSNKVSLNFGENEIRVTVIAETGAEKTYTIIVTRKQSDDNALSSLSLKEGNIYPEFSADTLQYNCDVENSVKKLTVSAIAHDSSATISIKNSQNGVVDFEGSQKTIEVKVTAQNKETRTYKIKVRRKSETNNLLASLSINDTLITPSFDPKITSYSAYVEHDIKNITINAQPTEETSIVTINGLTASNFAVNPGENIFKIKVTTETGKTKTYTLTVTRKQSNDNLLSSLSIKEGSISPVFSKDTFEYSLEVAKLVKKLTINAIAHDSSASISIKDCENGVVDFEGSQKTIEVKVTAENSASRTYKIKVTRKADESDLLSSLTVKNCTLTPYFDPSITSYTSNVDSNIGYIIINATPMDSTSTVTINDASTSDFALKLGTNIFKIKVKSQSGKTKTYTLTINRKEPDKPHLSSLSVDGATLTPKFSPDTNDYTAYVDYSQKSVTVFATPEKSNFKVSISGVEGGKNYLSCGENKIIITVQSSDGAQNSYTVTVFRSYPLSDTLSSLTCGNLTLSPAFSPDTHTYSATADYNCSTLLVSAEATESYVTVTINKSASPCYVNLAVGNNPVVIKLTSPSGAVSEYTVNILRRSEDDGELSELSLSNCPFTSPFNAETYQYNAVCENHTDKTTVSATPKDPNSTVLINGNKDNVVPLFVGVNNIEITVKSPDGLEKKYTVTITRKSPGDPTLKNLSLSAGKLSPKFSPSTVNYDVYEKSSVETVKINALPYDSSANVEINGNDSKSPVTLAFGKNTINIKVSTPDGAKKIYTLTITRKTDDDTKLKALNLSEGTLSPNFSPDTLSYQVSQSKSTSFKIMPVAASDSAKITINGKPYIKGTYYSITPYKYNTTVAITVENEDGQTRTYTIQILYIIEDTGEVGLQNIYFPDYEVTTNFDKDSTTYDVSVENNCDLLKVVPMPLSKNTKISVDGKEIDLNGFDMKLQYGNNYTVIRTEYSGKSKEYLLKINRRRSESAPTPKRLSLDNLEFSEGTMTPNFNKDLFQYYVTVPKDSENINVIATMNDKNKSMSINGKSLISGTAFSCPLSCDTSFIIINVKDGENETQYPITVTRSADELSYGLKSLYPSNGALSPAFSRDIPSYSMSVPNSVSHLTFNIGKANDDDVIKVNGKDSSSVSLACGNNTVTILTTHSDKSSELYTISVFRNFDSNLSVSEKTADGYSTAEIEDGVLVSPKDSTVTYKFENLNITAPCENLKAYKSNSPLFLKAKSADNDILLKADSLLPSDVSLLSGSEIKFSGGTASENCFIGARIYSTLSGDARSMLKSGVPLIYYYNKKDNTISLVDADVDRLGASVSFKADKTGFYFLGVKLTAPEKDYTLTTDKTFTAVSQGKSFNLYVSRKPDCLKSNNLNLVVTTTLANGKSVVNKTAVGSNGGKITKTVEPTAVRCDCYLEDGATGKALSNVCTVK